RLISSWPEPMPFKSAQRFTKKDPAASSALVASLQIFWRENDTRRSQKRKANSGVYEFSNSAVRAPGSATLLTGLSLLLLEPAFNHDVAFAVGGNVLVSSLN